ncbi:MAG: O-antigen ligase family protein [Aggregatilineales bacterium]
MLAESLSINRNGWLIQGGLYAGAIVAAILIGNAVATNNTLVLLPALGILPVILILQRPYISLIFAWAAFIFLPYDLLRTPIPFLASPLMVVVLAGLGIGIMKLATRRIALPRSNIYVPIGLWIGTMGFFVLIQHGPGISTLAQWYVRGMWGVPLVLLTVRTPRQAKVVLLCFFGLLVASFIPTIPAVLASGAIGFSENVSFSNLRTELNAGFHLPTIAALVWPLLYCIAIQNNISKRLRFLSATCAIIILLIIISSGFGSPVVTLFAGFVVSTIITVWNANQQRRLTLIPAIVLLSIALYNLNGVQVQLNRIISGDDASVNSRFGQIQPGIEAFLNSPIVGWGFQEDLSSPSNPQYGGHSTLLNVAVGFGLIGLLPMLLLFTVLGIDLIRLGKKSLVPLDRALVTGLQGVFCAYVAQGITAVSFGLITLDSAFWFLMAFALLWLSWLKTSQYSRLAE